ncbi:uncharacterized protein LOC106638397 [Copidosoma floridanum]|uniref:uncharacterized protein LOC106638397 n=1 Tax=Copidosoma floridanum TaxID=29053 RepID=UPI0006C95590|nr:uncharacterized protein LOC106638397 [Copidosoma floridanum]
MRLDKINASCCTYCRFCSSHFKQSTNKRLNYSFYCLPYVLLVILFFSTINGAYAADSSLVSRKPKKDLETDTILCRRCGYELASNHEIINHLSPQAEVIPDETLFERKGVDIQILKNSFNIKFHTITLTKSECVPVNDWYMGENWYPGYAWKPCICPRCRTYHGWLFEPLGVAQLNTNYMSSKAFFMLKLHNLASAKFVNSLLVTPKSYVS